MSETMSHVERVLWRIAELGARCSQHTAAGGREPLWAELEQTIAGLQADFEAARQAVDIAPAQVRGLEGRLKVARQERDREKARAEEYRADAEAARRERDRERQKARKAMGVAVEAKNAAIEARTTAKECGGRATAAEAALDQAMTARDEAVAALDDAITTGERAIDARDAAIAARDEALRELGAVRARIAELEAALQEAVTGQEDAVGTLTARAEGAIVVLPGVTLPGAQAGPATPASRVSWRPTWSEWATPETEGAAVADGSSAAADVVIPNTVDTGDDLVLDAAFEGDAPEADGGVRYLNVAATIAQLLPEDLDAFLPPGATLVRREGRLFATIAVTTNPWAPPGTGGAEQAKVFADAGFKVEWTTKAPLGV